MPLFMDDHHLRCVKCAGTELIVESVALYQLADTKEGIVLEEEQVGSQLRCARCGAVVKKLPRNYKHVKK